MSMSMSMSVSVSVSAAASAPVAWIRPGQAGYIGPDLGVDLHAASVGVLTVGLDAPFIVETPQHGAITARSFYAPARAPHRVVAPEGRILLLFTDSGASPLDDGLERDLIAACRHGADPGVLQYLAAACPRSTADRRIRRVVDEIHDDPSRILRAEQSAQGAGMSTAYFLRMFARHTGTTFRRYQQWNRLLEAARGIAAGHTLTRCAADAGFASPSHLSDTFHETLGTTATTVLGSRVRFVLDA